MKKGFATIQVVIVLSALTLLLLVVLEASAGYAAGSIAEDLCAVTGSSLLSEYNVALQKRYGVFAMSANRARLQAVGRYYLESGLQAAPMLVKLSLGSLSFRTEDWEAGDPSVFGPQIARLGAMALGRDLLTSEDLGGLLGGLGSLLSGDLSVDLSELGELTAAAPDDEDLASQRDELMQQLQEANREDDVRPMSKRKIEEGLVAANLPSRRRGLRKRSFLLFSGGLAQLSVSGMAQNEYILRSLSNAAGPREDTVLLLEGEYVLYGNPSDEQNERAFRRSLFLLRSAIDLAEILSDPEQMSQIASLAASSFALIPAPVAIAVICSIRAAMQAKSDVARVMGGGEVPILRDLQVPGLKGTYADYLRLLLMMLSEEEKLVRLMDIMQLNLNVIDGDGFNFRNYICGFSMQADLLKRMRVPVPGGAVRSGQVVQIHAY